MLYTTLGLYDETKNRMAGTLRIGLMDETLNEIAVAMERSGREFVLRVNAVDELGVAVGVQMVWDWKACGFFCSADGRQAGFILYDELMGAIGAPAGKQDQPVFVKLNGGIDVWRRGVLDADRGLVYVYTKQRMLIGGDAFLISKSGEDEICISLEPGDPSLGPLRVSSSEKHFLQIADAKPEISVYDALAAIVDESSEELAAKQTNWPARTAGEIYVRSH